MKDPSPGICRFNVSSSAEAAFQLWRKLHRTHVACAIDYPLWEFTRAFAAGFTAQINVLDVFPRLVSLGLCDFLEEVMSRADLLQDAPVRHLVLGN